MKYYIFFIQLITLFCFLMPNLQAQEGKITYRAYYGKLALASPPNENGYPNEYEIENAVLHFDGTKSLYIQEQNKTIVQYISGPNGTERKEVPRNNLDPFGTVISLDYKTKKQLSRETFWNKTTFVNIEENIIPIEWKITDNKKMIGNYTCVKASTSFLGREWEVWFSPDIPVPMGPWRLNGLPGLILEAYDSELDFIYQLAAVEIPHPFDPSLRVEDIFARKLLSRAEFHKENAKSKDKYVSYMKSVALENDGKVDIKFYPQIDLSADIENK